MPKIHFSASEVSALMKDQSSIVRSLQDRRSAFFEYVNLKKRRGETFISIEEILLELSNIDAKLPLVGRNDA